MVGKRGLWLGWLGLGLASGLLAQELANPHVRISPLGVARRWTGVVVQTTKGEEVALLRFGSLDNLTAGRLEQGQDGASSWLRFTSLQAMPTPRLGQGSFITVRLYPNDPFPQVSFRLEIEGFDAAAWEAALGRAPFHFLVCSLPGAEVFHQRGWSIMTPALDPYPLHGEATGYGRQIASEWSRDWTYAPPIGAYPLATVGLWKPSQRRYIAYDFHGARLTDHSEKEVASAYCWQLLGQGPLQGRSLREFFALVWPYAKPYREGLRYPGTGVVATHFRLLYSLEMPSDEDPNFFVHRFLWERYADLLPAVPKVPDLSWLSEAYRLRDFLPPSLPGSLYGRIPPENAQWWEPGSLVFGGLPWDGDPVTFAYEQGRQEAIANLKAQIRFLLKFARRMVLGGEECYAWQQCLEGEGRLSLFGRGVPTVRHVANWQLGLALLDVYRNEPQAERDLLPYIDGLLRFTKHFLTTRNCYHDVPAAQFCWSCGPITTFCLRYFFTFRNAPDEEHRRLAQEAYRLAHRMVYRYLTLWPCDNDEMDELDASFFFEPNAGISWLGAACSNEVWVVVYALAQVYVHTGDPLLSHYLLGALERWHELYRDEYYPNLPAYRGALTERLGLFEDSQQPKGTRATFGGLWGLAERLLWPVGSATVRVLCGERAALAFNRNGRHTDIADYRYTGEGNFSFRLVALGTDPQGRQAEPFDIVVTFPYFDLRPKPVFRLRGGRLERLGEEVVQRYPQRPDSLLIRGLRYGDEVAVGEYRPEAPVLPCPIAKPRRGAVAEEVRWPEGFQAIPLLASLNRRYSFDWDDLTSWAGWEPGRKVLYGVPFEFLDPLYTDGHLAVRDREVPAEAEGSFLFALIGERDEASRLTAVFADGASREVDLSRAFPVLRGWPPCFEWRLEWVALPLEGKCLRALRPQNLSLFAATVATLPPERLARTLEATRRRQEAALAEEAFVRRFRELAPLLERLSGRIAVLPGTSEDNPRSHPLANILHRTGLLKHVAFPTLQEAMDPDRFNAQRIWVALYLSGERYPQALDQPLRRFLHGGGTLLVLPRPGQPFPFYYNEAGRVVVSAPKFGLHVSGGWEKPPAEHRYTFRLNPQQKILTSLPDRFPFPEEGDPRWRPLWNRYGEEALYIPLLTLYDEKGQSVGDGAAWVEFQRGEFAGARLGYVWATLLGHPDYQGGLVLDLLRHALNTAMPGLAEGLCFRTQEPIRVDGRLEEAIWRQAPRFPLNHCFLEKQGPPGRPTEVRCAWDERNLYLAFVAEDPDIWSHHVERDANLWEGEVVEVYLDPNGDGRNYKEFEVNPLGAVIDLNIEDPTRLQEVDRYRRWNAPNWRVAVQVEGTVNRREDRDRRWVVEMAIPFADLGLPAAPSVGETWRVQFYRIERPQEGKPEFSAWSATETFHNPRRFGRLTFAPHPYRDDFGLYPEGSEGSPLWSVQTGIWRVQNGVLVGQDSGTDGWHPSGLRWNGPALRDFRLTVRFRLRERGSDHRDGLWVGFRWQGETGYALHLHASGAQLHKFADGQGTNDEVQLARVPWKPDAEWHTLLLAVQGNEIRAEFDGKPLLSARDENFLGAPPLREGTFLLSARRWSQSKGHTVVEVDEVLVEPR